MGQSRTAVDRCGRKTLKLQGVQNGEALAGGSPTDKEMSPILSEPPAQGANWTASGVTLIEQSEVGEQAEIVALQSASAQLGTVELSVRYSSEQALLAVTVLRASDLRVAAAATESAEPAEPAETESVDPYVKLQLLPEKRHRVKTRVIRHTRNPVFDETFSFYGIKTDSRGHVPVALHVLVLTFDRFSRDRTTLLSFIYHLSSLTPTLNSPTQSSHFPSH